MAKIMYYDGTKYFEVEVTNEVAMTYVEISRQEKRECWRKEKRRQENSIEEMLESGFDIADDTNIFEEYIKNCESSLLKQAISCLTLSQQKLVKQLFYENKTETEIAEQEKVLQSAISHRKERILVRLKNILKNF